MASRVRARAFWFTVLVGLMVAAFAAAPADGSTGASHRLRARFTATTSGSAQTQVRPLSVRLSHRALDAPPTTADCQASFGISCYQPFQLQKAYHLKSLYKRGLTGRGSTIVLVDSFGSPTAKADLKTFDDAFGLPAPPHFRIIQPAGPVPAFDPNDATMAGWAEETSLDIQWAHSIAPGANILLVETPVAETEGLGGIPEIVRAENYVVRHHLGDVISQSFGATENTFPSKRSLLQQRSAFKNAARHHVTVLASSGDAGPTDAMADGVNLYTHRVNSWPSSDPLVTSVGGTQLHLDAAGNRIAPDNVWNDSALFGGAVAGGGGRSSVFARPAFQDGVARVVRHRRGTPDISMSAAVDGGVVVYLGFTSAGGGITPGYYVFGGTSEASPELAGVVAIAKQRAHHRVGRINPVLYRIAGRRGSGVVDVRKGDNTVTFTQDGQDYTVPGFTAKRGYDLASGLGTVNAAKLTRSLAR